MTDPDGPAGEKLELQAAEFLEGGLMIKKFDPAVGDVGAEGGVDVGLR